MKEQNKRFMICVNSLIEKGIVRDRTDFIKKMRKSKLTISHLSLIATGKRNFTLQHLTYMCEIFGVSANYVILDMWPMYLSDMKMDRLNKIDSKLRDIYDAYYR